MGRTDQGGVLRDAEVRAAKGVAAVAGLAIERDGLGGVLRDALAMLVRDAEVPAATGVAAVTGQVDHVPA